MHVAVPYNRVFANAWAGIAPAARGGFAKRDTWCFPTPKFFMGVLMPGISMISPS